MKKLKTNVVLKTGYAGLGDVAGGKMWIVCKKDANTGEYINYYFTTKTEAVAKVREIYKDNPDFRNAVLNQLNECKGRAFFYR